MRKKNLGKSNLEVSALGLGCMNMSEFYGERDDAESRATLEAALEMGIAFFDTADMYGCGHNEILVGRVLGARRDRVIIATKFGYVRDEKGTNLGISGRPDYVRQACEASLRRLGTEYIDLYYQHRVDPGTPIEETVGAMAALVKAGKVRFLGLSEAGANTIRLAHAVHPITALQTEYSLWSREVEGEILPLCGELGIAFVAYSPLGRGFFSGTIRSEKDLSENDFRLSVPRFRGENFQQNLKMLTALESVARRLDATPSQIALAWVMAKGDDIVPIPGTRRRTHLKENVKAADIILSDAEIRILEEATRDVHGARYSEASMKRVGL